MSGPKPRALQDRLMEKITPEPNTGCWLWTCSLAGKGYGKIHVNKKRKYAHRVSFEEFIGPIPVGMCVCHKCDTPSCINPDHLFLGSIKENAKDMVLKNRQWNARVTNELVGQIRHLSESGLKRREIIQRFELPEWVVDGIIYNMTW